MDALIFYGFLLVLAIGFLIEGHRATSKVRPQAEKPVERSSKVRLLLIPLFVGVLLASKLVIEPVIEKYVPGANTGWVLSIISVCVMLALAAFVVERLERKVAPD